ncbi:MAG: tfuA protein, partial [Methylobacteriaceae bacterium]|nr:tfuA protein [Methylobacteriaceae bacterium]
MSEVVVFTGPTIGHETARALAPFDYRAPVQRGDVYRAVLEEPRVIAIIDGYFEGVPAVLHKEILFALSRGIHVFGAASMGALRAAELAPFGMKGVGKIYEAFRDGILEDDDEVAVLHGPEELGYPALTEAMVNIRA